jgi:hypothetical protein
MLDPLKISEKVGKTVKTPTDSVTDLKETLKCAVPNLSANQDFLLPHDSKEINVAVRNGTLSIALTANLEECNSYLTGVWIHIKENLTNVQHSQSLFNRHIPRKCFTVNSTYLSVQLPSKSSDESCNFAMGDLIDCRIYSLKLAIDYRTLKGVTLNAYFVVPPKVLSIL